MKWSPNLTSYPSSQIIELSKAKPNLVIHIAVDKKSLARLTRSKSGSGPTRRATWDRYEHAP
jgi:hypothetical protein